MKIFTLVFFIFISGVTFSQNTGQKIIEISTWLLVQTIPSPSFYQDNNNEKSRMQFGLKWNVTPVNYSFNANKMVSPLQFFKVNPMRRYGGSVELFVQPEWTASAYKFAELSRFMISPGIRLFIPMVESGEYLSGSIGMKYTFRRNKQNENDNVYGIEAGSYIFFGMIGLNYTYNFTNTGRHNFSINIKYY